MKKKVFGVVLLLLLSMPMYSFAQVNGCGARAVMGHNTPSGYQVVPPSTASDVIFTGETFDTDAICNPAPPLNFFSEFVVPSWASFAQVICHLEVQPSSATAKDAVTIVAGRNVFKSAPVIHYTNMPTPIPVASEVFQVNGLDQIGVTYENKGTTYNALISGACSIQVW